MIARGLAISLPWFALVNISFALMVLLRNDLFDHIDGQYQLADIDAYLLDGAMISIILLLSLSGYLVWRRSGGISLPLLLTGAIWAGSVLAFVTVFKLPFAWPLCAILLLTAMAALYFHPPALLSYALPLWGMMPVASLILNRSISVHFFASWLIFTLILLYGRIILQRWFDEAWQRIRQNQLLIARLDALAHQDPLTETANRRAMESILDNAVSQSKALAVIMLDVDHFKRYNDYYGHQAGDECLMTVAKVLKQCVRNPDDLVSRYGGEEFLIVLFGATEKRAELVATRIQAQLQAEAVPHAASMVSDNVTVSMGIASLTEGQTVSALIAVADAALYRAKEAGRNRWSH
ncbi:diguanylate cyclase [Citrobacter sp. Marseille-Q6884]|uniref:GGDEF domain-containing protein n=1 Tax=Citrobacter sp. Marseille-Q6884 TaxID=2956786 RepID=UPI0021B40108|nr:GGDEF domain-containing protein [Citrobacter sp. Marseille-Q6884]